MQQQHDTSTSAAGAGASMGTLGARAEKGRGSGIEILARSAPLPVAAADERTAELLRALLGYVAQDAARDLPYTRDLDLEAIGVVRSRVGEWEKAGEL